MGVGEIEARQPVRANTEVVEPIVINLSGSYYLVEDITAIPDNNALSFSANDVTLDLNGFTIRGNNEVTDGYGIYVTGENVTILNGNVRNADLDGIKCEGGDYLKLIDVSSIRNAGSGVACHGVSVQRGDFNRNGGSGIVGISIHVEGVRAIDNTLSGVSMGGNSLTTRSLVRSNDGHGFNCVGLSVVTQSNAVGNLVNNFGCQIFDTNAPL